MSNSPIQTATAPLQPTHCSPPIAAHPSQPTNRRCTQAQDWPAGRWATRRGRRTRRRGRHSCTATTCARPAGPPSLHPHLPRQNACPYSSPLLHPRSPSSPVVSLSPPSYAAAPAGNEPGRGCLDVPPAAHGQRKHGGKYDTLQEGVGNAAGGAEPAVLSQAHGRRDRQLVRVKGAKSHAGRSATRPRAPYRSEF